MTIGVWKENRALDNSKLLMYEESERFYGYQLGSLYLMVIMVNDVNTYKS